MGSLIDTHTHLNLDPLYSNWQQEWEQAKTAGLVHAVIVGTDTLSSQRAITIIDQASDLFASVGIHPTSISEDNFDQEIMQLSKFIAHTRVVAVGETGIDLYHKDNPPLLFQQHAFAQHIDVACKNKKAIIIHARAASTQMLQVLSDHWQSCLEQKVVFHCCEPKIELLEFALSHRCYIGVDGDVTYDTKKQDFIARVPLSHLVLETDAPYLQPEPVKTSHKFPNTPAHLVHIAHRVSHIHNFAFDVIADSTTANAKMLYSL